MNELISIYRALPENPIEIASCLKADLLSEAMSRVMASSHANKQPYFLCFTEDPRIAIRYAAKPGYSGQIARIKLIIGDDGNLAVLGDNKALVYRTWHMLDWLHLMQCSNWPKAAVNINYSTFERPLEDIITYGGRRSPRAYAHADRGFIVHAATDSYELLTDEEILKFTQMKVFKLHSYALLKYDFSDAASQRALRELIDSFRKRNTGKAHTRIMLEQLEELVA